MITEDYVSFETAKLLKKKGFNVPCFRYAESKEIYKGGNWTVANVTGGGIGVPTLQMAMKWLREEKGIAIIPIISSVLDSEKFLWDVKIVVAKTYDSYSQGWTYESYERICEVAIKYCLENLI